MTNNTDEFDQDQFEEQGGYTEPSAPKQSLLETIRNKPIVKLLVIMGVVGVALAGALGTFSSKQELDVSQMAKAPPISEAPGGASSPFFNEQNQKANAQRAGIALVQGGSAIPTPQGHDVTDLTDNRKDPLVEFRAETERLKQELYAQQKQSNQQMQLMQQQMQQNQRQAPEDDSLAKAMQKQMQQLMESWTPRAAKFVNGVAEPEAVVKAEPQMRNVDEDEEILRQASAGPREKVLVSAGTVNYVQLLVEANSDVPGPILVQILSGPFAGGRAIGTFQVMGDYLVMAFKTITLKDKEYQIEAMALDPDTTLGGLATEVDHRYFTRVLLPAAGAFVAAFGRAMGETPTETTVSDGTVVASQAKKGTEEALYAGVGEMGQTVADFLRDEANNTKTLVRVAVGTPMGLFFLKSVKEAVE